MKPCALTLAISLTLGGNSLAQDIGAGASNQSATSVSASRNNNNASAQQANNASAAAASKHAAASAAEASEMNATLTKPVNARRAKPGDEVTATLAHDATASGGTRMPRGTKLIGHVTEAQPHDKRSGSVSGDAGSRLGIVFDKAVLSDGREVPVSATIQAIGQAAASSSARDYDAGGSAFGTAGSAQGFVLTSDTGNVQLARGTQMLLVSQATGSTEF